MTDLATLTVVMPVYNEEAAIRATLEDLQRFVLDTVPGSDCIVIDDGSTDSTPIVLSQAAAIDPRITVIRQPNAGHGAALFLGMERARGDWLFLLDSDRQIPVEAFGDLRKAAQGRDGAFGVRAVRLDPPLRLALSRVIARAIGGLFRVSLRDANVPFKLFRRSLWLQSRGLIPQETLAPSMFLAIYARVRGWDIVELEVPHASRRSGVGSLRMFRLLRFCVRGFRQLLDFRRRLSKSALSGSQKVG